MTAALRLLDSPAAPASEPVRVFDHRQFTPRRLADEREQSVSVCVPTRNERDTIASIVACLAELREAGVIDQVVVVDDSSDGTAELARTGGAEVHRQADLFPELGPVLGKGDAMWRALSVLDGEIVCFVDGDSADFGPRFVCGLVGPLVADSEVAFVKGFYRRPFQGPGTREPDGGGRVTELTARPLLNLFYPQLAGIRQPLAGEIAARRELLERLPFTTGYGVDVGLLIDAWKQLGVNGLAQVDLEVRQNDHQPLAELGPMALAVARAITDRLVDEGRLGSTADAPTTWREPQRVYIDYPERIAPAMTEVNA